MWLEVKGVEVEGMLFRVKRWRWRLRGCSLRSRGCRWRLRGFSVGLISGGGRG